MSVFDSCFVGVWNLQLGKGQLPLAQTLLVVTNMKFGANEISVTFIIIQIEHRYYFYSMMSPGRFQTYQSKELKKSSKLSIKQMKVGVKTQKC